MNQVLILERAKQELKEAVMYYDDSVKGLGEGFEKIVLDKIGMIRSFPERYPIKRKLFVKQE